LCINWIIRWLEILLIQYYKEVDNKENQDELIEQLILIDKPICYIPNLFIPLQTAEIKDIIDVDLCLYDCDAKPKLVGVINEYILSDRLDNRMVMY